VKTRHVPRESISCRLTAGANVKPTKKTKQAAKAGFLGVGLDNEDGHTRLTRGDNFVLYGGSQETHGQMQETAVKINEQLSRRGKRVEDCSPREFLDILHDASR
jgi:hypothetical protein